MQILNQKKHTNITVNKEISWSQKHPFLSSNVWQAENLLSPRHNPIEKRDTYPTESVLWTGFPSLTENYKLTQWRGARKIPDVHIQIGEEGERKEGTTERTWIDFTRTVRCWIHAFEITVSSNSYIIPKGIWNSTMWGNIVGLDPISQ